MPILWVRTARSPLLSKVNILMRRFPPQPAGLLLTFVLIGLVTLLGPTERLLGANLRIVILHGAWVWAGLVSFALAAVSGTLGLLLQKAFWHRWSLAFGRTGLFFLLTYLPMSLLVMQLNWGGLFLDEPRWRIPMMFGVVGTLLQVGLAVINMDLVYSAGNLLFGAAFLFSLYQAENVLHPDSPVSQSGSLNIQVFFAALLALALLTAVQLALWWYRRRTA